MPAFVRKIIIIGLGIFFLSACGGTGSLEPTSGPLPTTTSTLLPTPTLTPTLHPSGLRFIAIPEQVTPLGEGFTPLEAYDFLRYRRSPVEEMTWSARGSEHLSATIQAGVLTVSPADSAWTGSEVVRVEACEPSLTCVTQEVLYSIVAEDSLSDVRVTYVGNAGFLVEVGDRKILIDAFFEGFPGGYVLPEKVLTPLLGADPPFDGIDLILATHDHGDHFSASLVRQHMEADPGAVFISTSQAAGQLADLGSRVISLDPAAGQPVVAEVAGIQVEAIYLSHGYPQNDPEEVFNNAYVVTVDGFTIFHTGDLAWPEDILLYDLPAKDIDLAFVPHFYLNSGTAKDIIENGIGADYLFPIHYEYSQPAINPDLVFKSYPEAVVFYTELGRWFMPLPVE